MAAVMGREPPSGSERPRWNRRPKKGRCAGLPGRYRCSANSGLTAGGDQAAGRNNGSGRECCLDTTMRFRAGPLAACGSDRCQSQLHMSDDCKYLTAGFAFQSQPERRSAHSHPNSVLHQPVETSEPADETSACSKFARASSLGRDWPALVQGSGWSI